MMHILGFYSVYYLSDPMVTEAALTISSSDDTMFFENAHSNVTRKLDEIMMENPQKSDHFLLISPSVHQYMR